MDADSFFLGVLQTSNIKIDWCLFWVIWFTILEVLFIQTFYDRLNHQPWATAIIEVICFSFMVARLAFCMACSQQSPKSADFTIQIGKKNSWIIYDMGIIEFHIHKKMGVSLNGGTPQNTPNMIIFSRKTLVVGYHHFRKPTYTFLGEYFCSASKFQDSHCIHSGSS